MLSREETIREYDFHTWRVVPDRLRRGRHPRYPAHAERMLQIYRTGIGRRRCELHADVEAVFGEEECDPRCIRAFQKLLDDGGEFERSRGEARALRHRVFTAAKEFYPLVREGPHFYGGRESEVKARIAQELGKSWGRSRPRCSATWTTSGAWRASRATPPAPTCWPATTSPRPRPRSTTRWNCACGRG